MNQAIQVSEAKAAMATVLAGALFVAANASKDSYFFGQFGMLWGPHAALLLMLFVFRARPAAIAGTSLGITLHLAMFILWERAMSGSNENGLAWLGYFFALPGGALAAILAALLVGKERRLVSAIAFGFGFTLAGLALNQTAACMTVIYCGFGG